MMPARRPRRTARAAARPRDEAPEFCTVAEAAALLAVSVSTVWRWVDAGKLPAFRVGPRAIRIRRTDAAAAVQPIVRRADAPVTNAAVVDVATAAKRWTREERARGLAALAAADRLRADILKRRKGRPLAGSASIVREARDARSRRA